MRRIGLAVCLAACVESPPQATERQAPAISDAVKRDRAALIRDAAAEMGLHNAALLGGVATSETNLAHCWEEAQFACMGPASPSCDGGPIIAGSADGPCSNEQGGLGMFQFDAGTYADTVATYTEAILTVEGNTAQAVAFVVDKAELDVEGVTDWMSAVTWLDGVRMSAGDPVMEQWSHLMACRYNGCCSTSALCESRADGYRDNAIAIFFDLGPEFWNTRDRCVLPDDGIIDQRTECYLAGGEPRFWRRASGGFGGDHEFTKTTASKAGNFARWLLRPQLAGTYRIEVHIPAGIATATAASYRVTHGGETTEVVIDQATADGFVPLGDFALAADGSEHVELADLTGTADQTLVFDAIRVTALDVVDEDAAGCCETGGTGRGSWVLAMGVLGLLLRRRRSLRFLQDLGVGSHEVPDPEAIEEPVEVRGR